MFSIKWEEYLNIFNDIILNNDLFRTRCIDGKSVLSRIVKRINGKVPSVHLVLLMLYKTHIMNE